MVKYSVIMPCYNLETTVRRTIRAVLDQTYKNFELIIIDDGSTDKTKEIIKEFEHSDERIKTYSKKNGGVSSARNIGVSMSQGEYIYFLDGDDYITHDLLEKANHVFKKKDIDMFAFGYKKTNEDLDHVIKKYSFKKYDKKIFQGEHFQRMFFSRKITQCMCSFIVKKTIISDNYILFDENTKYAEDQEFQLKCNINSKQIYYDSDEYFYYIQRKGSAMNQKVIRENFDVYFRMGDYINEDSRKYYDNYMCYFYVANLKEIAEKGSEADTVRKLLSMDYVLKKFKVEATKHGLLTGLFILYYRTIYKKYIKRKYRLFSDNN